MLADPAPSFLLDLQNGHSQPPGTASCSLDDVSCGCPLPQLAQIMCLALEVYRAWFNHRVGFQGKIINGDALAKNTKLSV